MGAHSTTAFEESLTADRQGDGALVADWPSSEVNVGSTERLASIIGGGTLAVLGLSRWSLGGLGLAAIGAGLVYRGATGHCGTYELMGMSSAEPGDRTLTKPIEFQRSITIDRPVEELYRLWRDFSNLPKFMENLEKVELLDGKRSHWVAKGPGDRRVEWDAEVTSERENERVS
ncbi:MAG TPA: YgaP-like transmembrane domain, partial [Pirellulales bacterium]|nr:YgaP-like transmembrane domain [Pirellulales bacterium]